MTGHPSADKQENSPAPTTTTSDDTSPQPAYCRSRRGRGRPRAVIKDRAEATTTPVSYGMTPPGWHHHRSQQLQPPLPPTSKGSTAGPILPNSKHACHYSDGPFGVAFRAEIPSSQHHFKALSSSRRHAQVLAG